ncbi:hypothetical protein SynRS9907_01305 [Synechococcus sp. RS9907]|nr:hypothetical protein SynRS9907_01305 [Synechococcus sp. RS9907]
MSKLKKYKKWMAKRLNSFNEFEPSTDKLIIDIAPFGIIESPEIHIARSKKAFRKAKKSKSSFIYDKKMDSCTSMRTAKTKDWGKVVLLRCFQGSFH